MKLLAELIDDQFENNGIDYTRNVVRAIVLDNDNKVVLIHVFGDDIFGHRDYYELPGGGVENNETLIDAIKREIKEELGVTIKDITPIGRVVDYYNLIRRKNNNHYFLAKVDKVLNEKHLEEYEKHLITGYIHVSIDEAIKLYEQTLDTKISILVKRRELIVLRKAKKMIDKMYHFNKNVN